MNITPIIETVFALIAAVITAIVIPYIRSKTTAQQQTEINAWVRIAVSAAEQIYVGSGRGQEKESIRHQLAGGTRRHARRDAPGRHDRSGSI